MLLSLKENNYILISSHLLVSEKVIFHTKDKFYCPKPGKVVKYVCPYPDLTSAIQYLGYLIVWPANLFNWYLF